MNKKELILGTVQLGMAYGINNQHGQPSREVAKEILTYAKQSGITKLDTADGYGESCNVIRESGLSFSILTKFKKQENTGPLFKAFEKSCCSLGVDKLWGYSFHSFADLQDKTLVKEIIMLKEKGVISKIGVSVYGNDEFEIATNHSEIDFIQLPFNLLDNYSIRGDLLKNAKAKRKEIHVRSIYLQGLFFKSNFPPKISSLHSSVSKIREIAKKNEMTVSELAFRYVLSIDEIDAVLFGVETVEQLKENLKLYHLGPLPLSIIDEINSIVVQNRELLSPVNWK